MGERPESEPLGPEADAAQQPGSTATANTGWSVLSLLIAGMLFWGGIGWLLDLWFDTSFFLPVLLIVGVMGALYLVARRYGTADLSPVLNSTEKTKKTE